MGTGYRPGKNIWVPIGTGYRPEKKFWVPMGTGYRPEKKFWVPTGTGYRTEKKFWVPMSTGYRPEKKFWVPMGTGYRENFHLCRPLVIPLASRFDRGGRLTKNLLASRFARDGRFTMVPDLRWPLKTEKQSFQKSFRNIIHKALLWYARNLTFLGRFLQILSFNDLIWPRN